MAQLHIFKGSYGTIEPAADDAYNNPQVVFTVDEVLSQCSPSLQALVQAHNPPVPANQVTTIEADEDVLEAVKAMLARSLQAQWNRGYSQVQATLGSRIAMGGPVIDAVLGLAQAGGATLADAVKREQEVANAGIERVVAQLTNVAPYWMNVHLKGVFISPDSEGRLRHTAAHEVHPMPVEAEPVPMVGWGDEDHPFEASAPELPVQDGYYDVTAAIPFYLPVKDGGAKAHAMRVVSRQFDFGGQNSGAVQEESPEGPTADKAQAVMDLVMNTPILRQMIVDQASQVVVDYDSRVETTLDLMRDEDFDDDDDDFYDDEDHGYYQRPAGG